MTLQDTISATTTDRRGGTMRAAVLDRFGDGSLLRLDRVPIPSPVLGEVLVQVHAAGINPIDVKTREGRGAAAGVPGLPAVLGHDFSGVVVQAPYEAFRLQPGDEVFGVSAAPRASGSFAEYVAVPAHQVVRRPTNLTHAEASAVPLAGTTAWQVVVDLVKAHEGQRVLVVGAAGGVGHLAVQIAAYFGAHVIAVAAGPALPWLHELGAAEVVDRTTVPFEQVVEPVNAVIDLRGDDAEHSGPRALGAVRHGGLLVNVPSASWPTLHQDAARAGVRTTTFRMVPEAASLAVLARLITAGDLRVRLEAVLPFERIAEAQQLVADGGVHGKIAVQVTDL